MSLYRSRWCGTLSKALAKSMIMRSVWIFLSEFAAISWTKDSSWVSQDLECLKPCWRSYNKLLLSRWLSTCFVMTQPNVSTHLNHRRLFLFSTRYGVDSLLCMRNINGKPHWLAICYLSRIFYFFLDRQFRS